MALVLGIGSGLFTLLVLWAIGLFVCVLFSRVPNLRNGVIGIGILLLGITFILIFYPRESSDDVQSVSKQPVDTNSIIRTAVIVIACVFFVISMLQMLIFHWMEAQYAPALSARKEYSF